MTQPQTAETDNSARRRMMEALAKAEQSQLEDIWAGLEAEPVFAAVRGPETGLVMIRGRIGGGGAPFNLGEATVSRATIRLETGEIGFGQTLGIAPRKAELTALFDAMAQRDVYAEVVADLVTSIEAALARQDAEHARRTAATRVDFFTMVRGED